MCGKESCGTRFQENCCNRKAREASTQSFALWQQAATETTHRNHSIIGCSHHVFIELFIAHIPFVVNRAPSAVPAERLQQNLLRSQILCIASRNLTPQMVHTQG